MSGSAGTFGRLAIGAVGFGMGAVVGMPALGAALGMGLGGMLFPPKHETKQRQVKGMLGTSSVEGTPLAVLFGRTRIGGTLLWKGKTTYHEDTESAGKGGSGSVVTNAWYTMDFAMVLGEGPMTLIQIYDGKNKISPSYTWYEGTETQLADSFLTSETGLSIPYKYTCYVVFQGFNVGPSASIPQLTFDVASGKSKFDVSLTVTDTTGITRNKTKHNYITVPDLNNCVTPPYAIKQLIKDDRYGAGFLKNVDWLEANTDCIDRSYFLNVAITERLDLAGLIEMLAAHGWVITVFSGSDVRLLLAKDTTPTKSYHLDDMIGKEHESVIDVSESGKSERFNRLSVEYTDPAKEYSTRPVQVEDLADQQNEGVKKNTVALPGFNNKNITKEVGYKMLRNSLYSRRLMNFSLGPKELDTEPGDVIYLNAIGVGLTLTRCRVMGVDEDEQFNLAITAREEPSYIFDPINYTVPDSFATGADNTAAGLSQVVGFTIQEIPKEALITSAIELAPIYGIQHEDTIGANIYYSVDNISYNLLKKSKKPSSTGIIGNTFDQDSFLNTSDLLIDSSYGSPDQTGDTFDSISRAYLMSTRNLSIIDEELMLFQNATLGTTASYTLSDFVRGRYNTLPKPHVQGSRFFLIDDIDRIDTLKSNIGKHYYFKAVPVNKFQVEGDISEVTAVGVTVQGWAYRPYRPGSIWLEENGISARGRTKTQEKDLTIAWDNCTKSIGFGTFPYNTGEYGSYSVDGDITTHEVDIYGYEEVIGSIIEQNQLNIFFTGDDESTTFTDLGVSSHTFTARGSAQIDTAQSKFHGSSGLFNGSSDSIDTPDHADWAFGSGNFTIDCWVRRNGGIGTQQYIISHQINGAAGNLDLKAWNITFDSSNRVVLTVYYDAGSFKQATSTSTFTSTSQWYHIEASRDGDNIRIFVDGVLENTNTGMSTSTLNDVGYDMSIGRAGPDGASNPWWWNGWIDELRIEKGTARHTATFTPPTSSNLGTVTIPAFVKTVDAGLTQSYTYTEADNIADNGSLSNDVLFRVYTKSIYGRSRYYAEKAVTIIN